MAIMIENTLYENPSSFKFFLMLVFATLLFVPAFSYSQQQICEPGGETSCQDSSDNDGDSFVDCDDCDCSADQACLNAPPGLSISTCSITGTSLIVNFIPIFPMGDTVMCDSYFLVFFEDSSNDILRNNNAPDESNVISQIGDSINNASPGVQELRVFVECTNQNGNRTTVSSDCTIN